MWNSNKNKYVYLWYIDENQISVMNSSVQMLSHKVPIQVKVWKSEGIKMDIYFLEIQT